MEEEKNTTQKVDNKKAFKSIGIFAGIVLLIVLAGKVFLGRETSTSQEVPTPEPLQMDDTSDVVLSSPQAEIVSGGTTNVEEVTELKIEDTKVGTGDEAVNGKKAIVHYTGYLTDGTEFDSSVKRGMPFAFALGAGEVIKGWDQGVVGMKVGGKRKLTIPPELGYGEAGAGGVIPPNAVLVFDVELIAVE